MGEIRCHLDDRQAREGVPQIKISFVVLHVRPEVLPFTSAAPVHVHCSITLLFLSLSLPLPRRVWGDIGMPITG